VQAAGEEGGDEDDNEDDDEELDEEGREVAKRVDWDKAEYELKMKRIKLLLIEGVYLMMMKKWEEASSFLGEVVGGDLTKNAIFMPFLAGGALMYGWCLYKMGHKDGAETWLGKSLKCFDIVRDGFGKAAVLLALVHVRVGPGGWGGGALRERNGEELDMLVDLFGKCFDIGNEVRGQARRRVKKATH
jgi:hypothetical protein